MLSKNLQQTDIFNKSIFHGSDDSSGGGAASTASTASAFATASRQNKNTNSKYTFVPKENRRKKGLDRRNENKFEQRIL